MTWRSSYFRWIVPVIATTAAVVGLVMAQGKPDNPGKGGGSKETVGNNLPYPAVHTAQTGTAIVWNVPPGTLGVNFSYGCEIPETIGTTTYPNTSCVDAVTGVPLSREQCLATKCAGSPSTLSRIYWQKEEVNDWWAQTLGPSPGQSPSYLDWADNLETVTWRTSSNIRVETTPFLMLPSVLRGYQMWHVFGQGTNEQWGVRTTDEATIRPYVYDSPYAIVNTPGARLNIAKLEAAASTCPTTGPPAPSAFRPTWNGSSWYPATTLRDIPYTAELNVGGKYVYGYNWALKRDEVAPWDKGGWWRLTFHTPDRSVVFTNAAIPTTPPPTVPGNPLVFTILAGDTGPLYAPVIDVTNNLTYIDICVSDTARGGGGGGGGKK